jgi:hypothetical protein
MFKAKVIAEVVFWVGGDGGERVLGAVRRQARVRRRRDMVCIANLFWCALRLT